jgi:hypothetical protein
MVTATPTTIPWWSWWTVLSLDAPLVAVAWQHLFAHYFGANLSLAHRCLLFLVVWLSYLADRWLDGQTLNVRLQHLSRHRFYSSYQRTILVFWAILVIVTLVIAVSSLSAQAWVHCLGLLLLTLLYLEVSHRQRWPIKELAVSLIFSLGVGLFLDLEGAQQVPWALASFGIVCFFNLSFIALWEVDYDQLQQHPSLIRQSPLLGGTLPSLALLCLVSFSWLARTQGLYLPMTLALLLLICLHSLQQLSTARRRSLADICLIVPVVLTIGFM